MILIAVFSFFAEYTFWNEFESRFNFIAVDYLVYTYEVVHNINESYPLPLLISGVVLVSLGWNWLMRAACQQHQNLHEIPAFQQPHARWVL